MSTPKPDSADSSPETLDLSVPPWVLIHDDDSRITFFDAFSGPTTPFVVADRESCLEAFESLASERRDVDRNSKSRAIVEELRAAGVLVPVANLEFARRANYEAALPFGHFDFEVAAEIDELLLDERARAWATHLGEIGLVPQSITVHFVEVDRMERSGRWTKLASLADRFLRCISSRWGLDEHRKVSVDFHAAAALTAIDESGLSFAEKYVGSIVRVRLDSADWQAADEISRWLARSGQIAALGFDVEVELHTRFDIDVRALCRDLIRRGHCTAIELKPRFPNGDRFKIDTWIDHAIAESAALPNELGSALHRSEPWKSILKAAVVPLHRSLGWNRKQAIVHLAADGRWSRSRHHASIDAPLELRDLFPAAENRSDDSWHDNRIRPLPFLDGSPDCENCAFLAICHRYWTPEFDSSLRRNESDRAIGIANYECQMRKAALGSLVLNLLDMSSTFDLVRSNDTLRAEFDVATKQVRIGR